MSQGQLSLEDFVQKPEEPKKELKTEPKKEPAEEPRDPEILSIAALNKLIRSSLEGQFNTVWVKGEISNFKPHTSGHHYFSLKDETSQISAVMFRGFNARLKFKPENGMEVVVRGRITVYEPRGNYQIFCEIMEPVGLGALQMAFEQLKAKLQAEGLFDPARKKKLPEMPKRIAIVTSPTGAAIQDMLNILSRRARGVEILLIPAVVQGAQAPSEIVKGIQTAEKLGGFDVLIVGRGGGSIEDLWGFNDESVARAIAACSISTISAVGHEIDFTIADFVADLRAPTPSAAAELVVKNTADVLERLKYLHTQTLTLIRKKIDLSKRHITSLERGLIDPKRKLQDLAIRTDELMQRMTLAMDRYIDERLQSLEILRHRLVNPQDVIETYKSKLKFLSEQSKQLLLRTLDQRRASMRRVTDLLHNLSPLQTVSRGYSIVRTQKDIVKSIEQIKAKDEIEIQFSNGSAKAEIKSVSKESLWTLKKS